MIGRSTRVVASALVSLVTFGATTLCDRAFAQVLDDSSGAAAPPGIPSLYCEDCDKPERVRVLPRLALPLLLGGAYARDGSLSHRSISIGVRPELTIGRIGERGQRAGRVHVGVYGEAIAAFLSAQGSRLGGGLTVAITTGDVTGASLSIGADARRFDGSFRGEGVASAFFGAWMPDASIPLVPTLGVRLDARVDRDGAASFAISLQIDPVMAGILLVGLAR